MKYVNNYLALGSSPVLSKNSSRESQGASQKAARSDTAAKFDDSVTSSEETTGLKPKSPASSETMTRSRVIRTQGMRGRGRGIFHRYKNTRE